MSPSKFIPVILLIAVCATAFTAAVRDSDANSNKDQQPNKLDDSTKALGKKVFINSCYACHKDTAGYAAPGIAILSGMTPRAILTALDKGKMRTQGTMLSEIERKAVAQFVTNTKLTETSISKDAYTAFNFDTHSNSIFDHSGWGGNLKGTGFRSAVQAGIQPSTVSSLQLKWTFAFPDGTVIRSKPAIAGNWLIIGGQFGDLYCIHRKTGKIGWHFEATSPIRGAIVVQKKENTVVAYFADFSTNVYAINVKTGKLLWNKRAGFDAQSAVTGSVAVYGNKLFVPLTTTEIGAVVNGDYGCCTSSGGVVALDNRNGSELWRHRVIEEPAKEAGKKKNGKPFYGPSGAPVWCSPTVDAKRNILYIGTGENYSKPTTTSSDAIQALDMNTGKLKWNFQGTSGDAYNTACPILLNCPEKSGPDLDFGMAPMLITGKDGKDILVAGQKSGVVYGLNSSGKLLWKTRIGKGGMLGGIHWGMATDGKYVYAANADNPIAIDRSDSSLKAAPGLYALDVQSGNIVWKAAMPACEDGKNCTPLFSAAPLVIPGIVFAGSTDGHIRAYSTEEGKILWDYNTAREYSEVNGIRAKGGSIDGPSVVVADGMLYVNSGYGMFGQKNGNVLLAFEVTNKSK